jgi:hypothetical protein
MQGLTATPQRVNASRSLVFHLGGMSDFCIKHTFHMSHGSIHSIRKIATLPNTTRAARQWEPCSSIHDGLHTTRQPCWSL